MKELSMEEKAKRYDEAFKEASVARKDEDRHLKATLERIFPELKESEDERIRQEIIYHIQNCDDTIDEETGKRMLAWLAKQAEQPKKHDVCDNCDQQGSCVSPCPMKLVEKQGEQKPYGQRKECTDCQFNYAGECKGYCAMKRGEQKPTENEPCEPWSGEQTRRNLIMYIKDSSKKEHPLPYSWRYIKWLENQKEATNFAELMNKLSAKEQEAMFNAWPKEQKPAWSVEDNRIVAEIYHALESCEYEWDSDMSKEKDWLESLGNRVQPQQEWSEEDEYHKRQILRILKDNGCSQTLQEKTEKWIEERLKSLRPQNTWKPSEEQMKALYDSIPENVMEISEREMLLNELYKDLKKL